MSGRSSCALLVAVALLVGCSDTSSDRPVTPDRREVVRRVVDGAIVPAVEEAAMAAARFDSSVGEFCRAPDEVDLSLPRAATLEGWMAWERTATFDFGPAMERRSNSLIAYEVDPAKIDARLAENPPSEPETVRNRMRANLRGYGAADHLLASDDPATYDAGRCGYLQAIAATVREETEAVAAAWTGRSDGNPPFAETAAGLGEGAWSATKVIDALVNMQLSDLERTEQRFTAFAEATPGQPAPLPPRAIPVVRARVEGIAAIYFLENGGVAELLSSRTRQSLQSRIDETLAVLGRTEEPESSEAAAVGTAIKALRTVIATEVVSTLGVTATFSDNDGDS
jgi:predicted lipoprotein